MEISFQDHQIWSTLSTSLLTMLLLWVVYTVVGMVETCVITPMRIKRIMNKQGVKGSSFHLLVGNFPELFMLKKAEEEKDLKIGDYNIVSHVMPFHVQNLQAYGKSYLWWAGWEAAMTTLDLDLMKQILIDNDHVFTKSQLILRFAKPLLGKGLVTTSGKEWALHRRIVNPAFHPDKAMVVTMEKCASSMANEWEKLVKDGGGHVELEVGDFMKHVSSNIIAHVAFGSSYEKGKKLFEQQEEIINLMDKRRRQ